MRQILLSHDGHDGQTCYQHQEGRGLYATAVLEAVSLAVSRWFLTPAMTGSSHMRIDLRWW